MEETGGCARVALGTGGRVVGVGGRVSSEATTESRRRRRWRWRRRWRRRWWRWQQSGDGSGCWWCWRFKGDILNGWFSHRSRLPLILSNTVARLAAPWRFARIREAIISTNGGNCKKEPCSKRLFLDRYLCSKIFFCVEKETE